MAKRKKAQFPRGTRVMSPGPDGTMIPGEVIQVWRNWVDEKTGEVSDIIQVVWDERQRSRGGMSTGAAFDPRQLEAIPAAE